MITGTSGHSPLIARRSSRPSRSGIRTSTSARSNASRSCGAPPAPPPRTPPRPRRRRGTLPSRRSSGHDARARGRPRSRSSSSFTCPLTGSTATTVVPCPGVDVMSRVPPSASARARMIRMPKCGSSSGTATMPRPRSCTSMRSESASTDSRDVRFGSSRVLRGVGERLAGDRVGGLHRGVVQRLDVALHRRRSPAVASGPRSRGPARRASGSRVMTSSVVISKSSSRMWRRSSRISVSISCRTATAPSGIGLDPVAERLQLQDGRGHGLREPVVDLHRPAGALLEQDRLHGVADRGVTARDRVARAEACSAPTRTLRSLPA